MKLFINNTGAFCIMEHERSKDPVVAAENSDLYNAIRSGCLDDYFLTNGLNIGLMSNLSAIFSYTTEDYLIFRPKNSEFYEEDDLDMFLDIYDEYLISESEVIDVIDTCNSNSFNYVILPTDSSNKLNIVSSMLYPILVQYLQDIIINTNDIDKVMTYLSAKLLCQHLPDQVQAMLDDSYNINVSHNICVKFNTAGDLIDCISKLSEQCKKVTIRADIHSIVLRVSNFNKSDFNIICEYGIIMHKSGNVSEVMNVF